MATGDSGGRGVRSWGSTRVGKVVTMTGLAKNVERQEVGRDVAEQPDGKGLGKVS